MSEITVNPSDVINDFFKHRKIEYYAVLPYSECRETNSSIMQRENFEPKSVIVFLLPYYTGECMNLSRYAASLDYHIAIRELTNELISVLREWRQDGAYKGYGDHSPIDECHAALIGGLGILGDSGLLINEKYGTYVFIGDIVTDIPPELLGAQSPRPISRCSHCGSCLSACPTGILRGEGEDCLSAITQRKGELSEEETSLMKKYNTVWGCDECQSSCPHNSNPVPTPIEFFYKDRLPLLTSDILAGMNKEQFSLRAFAWRGRKTVERNLKLLNY